MAHKAEHHYENDFRSNVYGAGGQNKWVWGVLAALAAIAAIVWFATSGGPMTNLTVTEQPGATTGTVEPVAPAAPAAPATPASPPAQ
jgi:hypothetical protein